MCGDRHLVWTRPNRESTSTNIRLVNLPDTACWICIHRDRAGLDLSGSGDHWHTTARKPASLECCCLASLGWSCGTLFSHGSCEAPRTHTFQVRCRSVQILAGTDLVSRLKSTKMSENVPANMFDSKRSTQNAVFLVGYRMRSAREDPYRSVESRLSSLFGPTRRRCSHVRPSVHIPMSGWVPPLMELDCVFLSARAGSSHSTAHREQLVTSSANSQSSPVKQQSEGFGDKGCCAHDFVNHLPLGHVAAHHARRKKTHWQFPARQKSKHTVRCCHMSNLQTQVPILDLLLYLEHMHIVSGHNGCSNLCGAPNHVRAKTPFFLWVICIPTWV